MLAFELLKIFSRLSSHVNFEFAFTNACNVRSLDTDWFIVATDGIVCKLLSVSVGKGNTWESRLTSTHPCFPK